MMKHCQKAQGRRVPRRIRSLQTTGFHADTSKSRTVLPPHCSYSSIIYIEGTERLVEEEPRPYEEGKAAHKVGRGMMVTAFRSRKF